MLMNQAIQPCYIFLHSFPPVLSFTLVKEQESVANSQNKVVHVPDQTFISQKVAWCLFFQWKSDTFPVEREGAKMKESVASTIFVLLLFLDASLLNGK